ncbi:hypothetical protein GJ496_005314 [Pomphorhynchus laevis]|nr:hypothetical protein GJ496_005314 [Pomphorhynchus laevis]
MRNSDDTEKESRYSYFASRRMKLENQMNSANSENKIFDGLGIYVNGYTKPDGTELRHLVKICGGKYYLHYDPVVVTHIVASNLSNSKQSKITKEKVVSPDWIVDSFEAGIQLPVEPYTLYSPSDKSQSDLNFKLSNESGTDNQRFSNIATTANDPGFLDKFFSKSRLHLISKLASEMKQFAKTCQKPNGLVYAKPVFSGDEIQAITLPIESFQNRNKAVYVHIDIDCFFVSVALIDKPHLKDKPCAVTHSEGKSKLIVNSYSDIASCNYKAREFGVKNGMTLGNALRICPNIQTLPYNFIAYPKISLQFYSSIIRMCNQLYRQKNRSQQYHIEGISCDELLIELKPPIEICPLQFTSLLRLSLNEQIKCNCSAGLGSNRIIARMALKHSKPNNQFMPTDELSFVHSKPIEDIPGLGFSLVRKMNRDYPHIQTCGQLFHEVSLNDLVKLVGNSVGNMVHALITKGEDIKDRSKFLSTSLLPKTISVNVSYGLRFDRMDQFYNFIRNQLMPELIDNRLTSNANLQAGQLRIVLKYRHPDADMNTAKFLGHGNTKEISKTIHIVPPTKSVDRQFMSNELIKAIEHFDVNAKDIRGISLQLCRIAPLMFSHMATEAFNSFREIPEFKRSQTDTFLRELNEPQHKSSVKPLVRQRTVDSYFSSKSDYTLLNINTDVLCELPTQIRKEVLEDRDALMKNMESRKYVKENIRKNNKMSSDKAFLTKAAIGEQQVQTSNKSTCTGSLLPFEFNLCSLPRSHMLRLLRIVNLQVGDLTFLNSYLSDLSEHKQYMTLKSVANILSNRTNVSSIWNSNQIELMFIMATIALAPRKKLFVAKGVQLKNLSGAFYSQSGFDKDLVTNVQDAIYSYTIQKVGL